MAGKTEDKAREAAPEKQIQTCTVTVQGAYIRALPCPGGTLRGCANRGDRLQLVDAQGCLPVIHAGRVLWAPQELGALQGTALVAAQSGPLLEAPGGASAAAVAAGSRLQLADTTRWRPVMYQGTVCWISRQFTME